MMKAAIASGAIAALGGAVALVRSRGYAGGPALASLEPWQYAVVQHLARRVCAADAPDVVTPDEADVAGFVDGYVATMPSKLRRDLMRFLLFVEQLAPIGAGMATRYTRLAPEEQDRVLASLEASTSDLLRGGFDAVKALLFMGYYRDPRTWSILGYEGPLVPPAAPG
jgi:hypothetical protein